MTTQPFHHAQIVRSLPAWSKALHPDQLNQLLSAARKDYLDPTGTPYDWYSNALPIDQEAIRRAGEERDSSREALHALLAPLKSVGDFCRPLLQQRLAIAAPVDQAQYVFQATQVEQPTRPPGGPSVPTTQLPIIAKGQPQLRSLLEAALHNFEGPEDTTRLSRLQISNEQIAGLPELSLAAFIDHCRALDLGQQYQDHLSSIFDGDQASQIQAAAIKLRRDEMRLQARIASAKGLLSHLGVTALHALSTEGATATYADRPLTCWQITLFGVPINEVMFMAPQASEAHDPVMLYIPGAEDQLQEFTSLGESFAALKTALLEPAVRNRWVAFAPQRLQPELMVKLKRALYENSADDGADALVPRQTVHLDTAIKLLPSQPWATLETRHLTRLKGDARAIAVPTADVDANVRAQQLQHWLELGLTVLNVAAFFIPVLNPLMLTLGAAQLMGSVFQGISAWEDGDNAEAVAQLESILLNVALVGAAAGAGVALQASGFVDAMRSIRVGDEERLWHPNIAGYASEIQLPAVRLPDQTGLYHLDGRTFVRIDEHLYETQQGPDGDWRVVHPQDRHAYSPALERNANGAWRLAHESPLEWDRPLLLRRLGRLTQSMDAADLDSAWRSTGLDDGVLQRLHVAGERMPALLEDALARLDADQQVSQIIAGVRHARPLAAHNNFALPALLQLPGWPADHVVQVFEGSERWGASTFYRTHAEALGEVVIQISRSELESGDLANVVLAQMEDPSVLSDADISASERPQALQNRLADWLEGSRQDLFDKLYPGIQPPATTAVTRLRAQFPGLPTVACEEIENHASSLERQQMNAETGRIPLRVLEEARLMLARSRLDRAILGLHRPFLATADSGLLIEGLQAQQPGLTGTDLFNAAVADRATAARLIGQQQIPPGVRSPLRLADGRIGYPLSGRGVPRPRAAPPARRLQALYPELSNGQISELQAELAQSGNLATAIRQLEVEQRTLHHELALWIDGAGADFLDREERQQCAEVFRSAWRREGGAARDTLTLERMRLAELPRLSARFGHIRALHIGDLQLQRLAEDFFSSFPRLEELSVIGHPQLPAEALYTALNHAPNLIQLQISGCGLSELSSTAQQALIAMRRLRTLDLSRNQLRLDDAQMTFLSRLRIDALSLSSNRIVLDQALATRFQDLINLQVLQLDFNPLGTAPDVSYLARLSHLSMSNCDLQGWPQGLTTLMSQNQYQLRSLDLSSNRIHTVPDLAGVMLTPYARDLSAGLAGRNWRFNYNDLEVQTHAELASLGVSVYEREVEIADWQLFWRADATAEQEQLWGALFDHGENGDLSAVLQSLAHSAEARRQPEAIATRVWALLEQASLDTDLRRALNEVAQAFPPTCGDAGTDGFSAMEIELLTHAASRDTSPLPSQWQLYQRLFRRAQVDRLADRIALRRTLRKAALQAAEATGNETALPLLDPLDDTLAAPDTELYAGLIDDIEIRLALRQQLATTLNYPEPSSGMLYEQIAMLNDRIRNNVAGEVLRLDQDPQARLAWLVEQPGWAQSVRAQNAEQFSALTDYWRSGLDYLDYCLDASNEPVTRLSASVISALQDTLQMAVVDSSGSPVRIELNSALYQAAIDSLLRGQRADEQGLLASITRSFENTSD
nr:NEL-type E3 ubiquitin ligase domain-containing protein [uncultured Pseudomonas sp.]